MKGHAAAVERMREQKLIDFAATAVPPGAGQVAEEVPAAKALFVKASDILGYDLLERVTNGPKDILDSTVRQTDGQTTIMP